MTSEVAERAAEVADVDRRRAAPARCWTPVENSQLYGTLAPAGRDRPDRRSCSATACRSSRSTSRRRSRRPRRRVRSCCCRFSRSQSGTKLPFASVHVRVDRVGQAGDRVRRRRRRRPERCRPRARYLLERHLDRRLAVAEQVVGRAEPRRDVLPVQPLASGKVRLRFGTSGAGPRCCSGKYDVEVVEAHAER